MTEKFPSHGISFSTISRVPVRSRAMGPVLDGGLCVELVSATPNI